MRGHLNTTENRFSFRGEMKSGRNRPETLFMTLFSFSLLFLMFFPKNIVSPKLVSYGNNKIDRGEMCGKKEDT